MWGNLGSRVVWDHEIAGSNPVTGTFNNNCSEPKARASGHNTPAAMRCPRLAPLAGHQQYRQPGRSTVKDAVLIRRRRRFDSFSGYAALAAFMPWSAKAEKHADHGESVKLLTAIREDWSCSSCIVLNRYPRPIRGRGVTAAHRSFKPTSEGSTPSGLIEPRVAMAIQPAARSSMVRAGSL